MNQVKEFYDIAELNAWLKEHDTDYEFKKIYRSTDQLYFVWYSFDPKISNEEFDEIDQEDRKSVV